MAEYEVEFGVPGEVAFSYVHIKVGSHDLNDLFSAMQKAREVEIEARALHAAMLRGEGSTQAVADSLVKSELGGTVMSTAPPGLGDIFKDAVADRQAATPAPWDQPTTAAPMPWDMAPTNSPVGRPPVLIELPFTKEGDANYERVRQFKNYFFQQRNKLEWNKGRKGFEFTSTPTPEQLDMARKGAAALGGKVVE